MNESNITPEQQISSSLIMPTSTFSTQSLCQKRHSYVKKRFLSKNNYIMQELNKWIDGIYSPTHLLTIQLPDNLRHANKMNAITHLRNIMKEFERILLNRHWNKKHLSFICFEEKCTLLGWHFHILLNKYQFSDQQLQDAILAVNIKLQLPSYCLNLCPIIDGQVKNVEEYSQKQIKVDEYAKFDSDRIILSHDLFYLPYKIYPLNS